MAMEQNVGATAFDYPDSQNPRPHFKAFYGNQNVPHRTNEMAKNVNGAKVMKQVMDAK